MRKAFTLIELLVVIAVIAVLAAMLFPVFARARELAKRTHCLNNLKQLGTALEEYKNDYEDKYPWAGRADVVITGDAPSYRVALASYVTDPNIWECPSDVGEIFMDEPRGYGRRTEPFYKMAFASSYEYIGIGWPAARLKDRGLAGWTDARVKQPSLMAVMMELRPWHGPYDPHEADIELSPAKVNVLYCDGHASQRTVKEWRDDIYFAVK